MMNKMMKKVAVMMAAATMAIAGVTIAASANDGMGIDAMTTNVTVQNCSTVKYVNAPSGANVRTAPTTDAKVIRIADFNTQVQVTGMTSNGWYQVITTDPVYGGESTAYVAADLLSESKSVAAQYAASRDNEKQINTGVRDDHGFKADSNIANKREYTVNVASGTFLALRNDVSSSDASIIGQLYNGQKVTVIDGNGTFWFVDAPTVGRVGYVNSNYLA